jgi:shikimate 5-dehydrogenase
MLRLPVKAQSPTIYFIGVTTQKSSIMNVFPKWAKALSINAGIVGIDIPIHADPKDYIDCVDFIKNDPLSMGALITTHKIDLFHASRQLFDYIDPYAEKLEEISSISKKNGKLCCHAKDPISSGLAMEAFVPLNFWSSYGGEVLLLGAGGSALAMSLYLTQSKWGNNVPSRIIITNRSMPRLEAAKRKLEHLNPKVRFEFIHTPNPSDNDIVLEGLKPYSLIVNATGLGKDAPGSPITDEALFPQNSLVWEINYRGKLDFMHQADKQKIERDLHVEDGWIYFIHGWTQVISEVFHISANGKMLQLCNKIAMEMRDSD